VADEEKQDLEAQAEEAPAEEAPAGEAAAEPPVRDSGPVEGDSGEPGGSPGQEEAPAAEEPAGEEAPAPAEEPAAEEPAAEEPAAAEEQAAEGEEAPAAEGGEVPAAEAPARTKPKRKPRSERRQRSKPKREKPEGRRPITRVPKPVLERGRRQARRGVVVSSAMDKTIVVRVDTVKAHSKYKKVVRRSTKFHAHDADNAAKVGDVVLIVETRPLSKTKNWRLAEVLEVAK
jgi:small subunit ribosomal protein S17